MRAAGEASGVSGRGQHCLACLGSSPAGPGTSKAWSSQMARDRSPLPAIAPLNLQLFLNCSLPSPPGFWLLGRLAIVPVSRLGAGPRIMAISESYSSSTGGASEAARVSCVAGPDRLATAVEPRGLAGPGPDRVDGLSE